MTGFDYSGTARRPEYGSLPRAVRDVLGEQLGGEPDCLDADTLLRTSPRSAGVPAGTIGSCLAVLAAFMVTSGLSDEVPGSPRLRAHGRFTARIMVDWLSERRKWAA